MGRKSGGMSQRSRPQGHLGPACQPTVRCLSSGVRPTPDAAAHSTHDEAGWSPTALVSGPDRRPRPVVSSSSLRARPVDGRYHQEPHLPSLCNAQRPIRNHAVRRRNAGQGANKGEIGGHACQAIRFWNGFRANPAKPRASILGSRMRGGLTAMRFRTLRAFRPLRRGRHGRAVHGPSLWRRRLRKAGGHQAHFAASGRR